MIEIFSNASPCALVLIVIVILAWRMRIRVVSNLGFMIPLHEMGHLLGSLSVLVPVEDFQLWSTNASPAFVQTKWEGKFNFQLGLLSLAGPLASMFPAWYCDAPMGFFFFLSSNFYHWMLENPLHAWMGLSALFGGVYNLIPRTKTINGEVYFSDGLQAIVYFLRPFKRAIETHDLDDE